MIFGKGAMILLSFKTGQYDAQEGVTVDFQVHC
jgi:hypothetical protein